MSHFKRIITPFPFILLLLFIFYLYVPTVYSQIFCGNAGYFMVCVCAFFFCCCFMKNGIDFSFILFWQYLKKCFACVFVCALGLVWTWGVENHGNGPTLLRKICYVLCTYIRAFWMNDVLLELSSDTYYMRYFYLVVNALNSMLVEVSIF